jgi:uncharacterized protein
MQTINSYNPLIYKEAKETETLTSIILDQVQPQAIFLLGSSRSYRKTTTIFSYDTPTAFCTSHYYLLVLMEKDDEHSLNSVQDKIENNLQHFMPATAIVLSTEAFFAGLNKGHYFANNVLNKAEKLYQTESLLFPIASSVNEQQLKECSKQLFTQTKSLLQGFLASAELHKLRQEYKLASFMLHQAAEQALRTMLMIVTGLKINTHSIDKLIRYCSMFCYELPHVFQRNNEKEKRLYSLLNKAYIHTRYKDDYSISFEELTELSEKLKRIIVLFENHKPN